MKKFLVVCAAATLCCSLVSAQEAEDAGSGAVLSIIPRLDAGMLYDFEGKEASFSFGNTSLYTLFEGNISQNWSFSIANHWVASDGWAGGAFNDAIGTPTADLYSFHLPFQGVETCDPNFLDWAYLTYSPGDFSFSLGKVVLLFGGWESDEYDFADFSFKSSDTSVLSIETIRDRELVVYHPAKAGTVDVTMTYKDGTPDAISRRVNASILASAIPALCWCGNVSDSE